MLSDVVDCSTKAQFIYRYLSLNEKDRKDLELFSRWMNEGESGSKTFKIYIDIVGNDKDHRLSYLLKNRKLYCTTPSGFNDPYDCNVEFDPGIADQDVLRMFKTFHGNQSFTQEEWMKLVGQIGGRITEYLKDGQPSVDSNHKQAILDICKSALQKNVDRSRLVCFSKDQKNTLMWAHYSDKHEGICLKFSVEELKGTFGPFEGLFDMAYSELRPLLMMTSHEFSSLEMGKKILLAKSIDWEYEQEVRYIGGFNEYRDFSPEALSGLILGAKMPDRYKEGFRFLLENLPDYSDTPLSSAKIDPWKYQVDIPNNL